MVIELTIENILLFMSVVGAVSAFVTTIVNWVGKIRKPEKDQNDMLKKHEDSIAKLNTDLESMAAKQKDDIEKVEARMTDNENETRLVMKGILALVDHSIDGNNTKQLKSIKTEYRDYLVSKK